MTHFSSKFIQTALLTSGLFLFSACGGGGDEEGNIDVATYLPANNMVKEYGEFSKWKTPEYRERKIIETITVSHIDEHTVIDTDRRLEETNGTLISTSSQQVLINENNISYSSIRDRFVDRERYVKLGDSLGDGPTEFALIDITDDNSHHVPVMTDCTYSKKLTDLAFGDFAYEGELLEIKCEHGSEPFVLRGVEKQFHYSTYRYLKESIGTIAKKTVFCTEDPDVLSDFDMENCDINHTFVNLELLLP